MAAFAPVGAPHLSPTPAAGFQPLPLQGHRPAFLGRPAANVDINDKARQIGTQNRRDPKGFLPFDSVSGNTQQLAADYERLRCLTSFLVRSRWSETCRAC